MAARGPLRPALVAVGIAVSIVFTYLAVRNVDLDVFWAGIRESEYWWVAPALAVQLLSVWLKGVRWRFLFSPGTRPPLGAATRALFIGYFFNNILPARAGEALRVVALHREAGTSRAEALATAVSERFYDIVALLVLLFAALPFLPEVTWLRSAGIAALVVAVGAVALVLALSRYGERPVRVLLRPLTLIPRVDEGWLERTTQNVTRGLAAFYAPGLAARAFALTVASWLLLAVSFWLLMLGFDLGTGFGSAYLAMIAMNLALVIPSSAAAVGVFEAAILVALAAYGVDESRALSYAVVLHALNFFPYVVIGLLLVRRQATGVRRDELAPSGPL